MCKEIAVLLLVLGLAPAAWPATARAGAPPVRSVLFTHIEDNTPAGTLGSAACRTSYVTLRTRLVAVGGLMRDHDMPWSLQPDWKILRAALLYEDAALMGTTNGKNLFRYLREDLGVVIDPHSHESGGYNYTDVAHLLDSLGVGGSTVIGGHVWDPSLPEFAEWDRFRVPVPGERYPWASWRGDILMGSGTPGHVNDPVVSGVWRPRDRDHYFEHDAAANIAAIGQYRGTMECIAELAGLYAMGAVPHDLMLTSSYHVKPATISRPDGLAAILDSVITPAEAYEAAGTVVMTDFTSLVNDWMANFGGRGFIFDAEAPTGVGGGDPPGDGAATPDGHAGALAWLTRCAPSPVADRATVSFTVTRSAPVRIDVVDMRGRRVATLVAGTLPAGRHSLDWNASDAAPGIYAVRLTAGGLRAAASPGTAAKLVVVH